MKTAKTIDSYISGYPAEVQTLLQQMRATIHKAAPKAEEAMKYGIPTFVLNGNLVHFGAFNRHIGFYPASSGKSTFRKEFSVYKGAKGSVQFPFGMPLPLALITKVVKFRAQENLSKRGGGKKGFVHYHKDGSIWAKGKVANGVMEGYWEWFRKDGVRMRSGSFKKGKQVGEWTTYDKTGKVHKVTNMKK